MAEDKEFRKNLPINYLGLGGIAYDEVRKIFINQNNFLKYLKAFLNTF
jgi:hypothetical protein